MNKVALNIKRKIGVGWFFITLTISLSLLVCLLPVVGWFDYDRKRFAEVLLIMYMLIGLAGFNSVQNILKDLVYSLKPHLKLVLVAMTGLIFLSIYFSHEKSSAVIEGVTLVSLVLMALIVSAGWSLSSALFEYLIFGISCSILVMEIRFLTYYVAHLVINDSLVVGGFFPTFENVRFFNQYQIWILPFFSFISFLKHDYLKNNRLRYMIWVAGIVWWGMFFTTGGRGVILSALTSAIFLKLIYGVFSLSFLKRTFLMAVLGYFLYQFMFGLVPWLIYGANVMDAVSPFRSGSSSRLEYLWPIAVDLVLRNPILGVGPMHYAWFTNEIAAHPHNSILQIAAEWGVPNLIAILYMIFLGVRNWFVRFNKNTLKVERINYNNAVICLSYSLLNAMIYSLFCGVIVMPISHLTGVLIISLMLSFYRGQNSDSNLCFGRVNISISLVVSFAAITYFFFVFQDGLPRLMEPGYLPEIDLNVNGPRFWMIGDISK